MRGALCTAAVALVWLAAPAPSSAQGIGGGASGGTITQAGGYTIHTFTMTGTDTLVVHPSVTAVEVVVVGGGGGGGGSRTGSAAGGGGGAGGLLHVEGYTVSGPVTVTVGGGGPGGAPAGRGGAGEPSSFGSLVAAGGGGGGGSPNAGPDADGESGGSGGGGGCTQDNRGAGVGGAGTGGQGFGGGAGLRSGRGGGGGGARTAGSSAAGNAAGAGGAGRQFPQFAHEGSPSGYFAGGGGSAAGGGQATVGEGGEGGGGSGGKQSPGTPGAPNTGGGGGGSGNAPGASGGSGVVIVRYPTPMINAVWVTGDAPLAIGAGIVTAGQGQAPVTHDLSRLSWISVVHPPNTANKITARLPDGGLPAGLELRVTLRGVERTLGGTAQDLLIGLGNEAGGDEVLTYTLTVTDFGALVATPAPASVTVEYAIEPER